MSLNVISLTCAESDLAADDSLFDLPKPPPILFPVTADSGSSGSSDDGDGGHSVDAEAMLRLSCNSRTRG